MLIRLCPVILFVFFFLYRDRCTLLYLESSGKKMRYKTAHTMRLWRIEALPRSWWAWQFYGMHLYQSEYTKMHSLLWPNLGAPFCVYDIRRHRRKLFSTLLNYAWSLIFPWQPSSGGKIKHSYFCYTWKQFCESALKEIFSQQFIKTCKCYQCAAYIYFIAE